MEILEYNIILQYYMKKQKSQKKLFIDIKKKATNVFKVVQDLKDDEVSYKMKKLFEPMMRFTIKLKNAMYNML